MSAELSLHAITRDHGDGSPPALCEVDLTVGAGACAAVVGPSGSGKSTVLRIASGLDRPDAGDVLLDGRSVLAVPAERRQVALMLQRPLLFPHLSVLDNVAFPARVAGASRREARRGAADYLDLVRLDGYGRRRAGELSGGQEQRVALARALAARPRVLLLDEPFSALDVALRAEMHDLLRHVRSVLEPTIVLVTHDPGEAAALADTVAVLDGGRVEQHAGVDLLYRRPASLTVARIMGGRNEVPGEVRGGAHHSVLGRVALPPDVRPPEGAGVLVVRHESVDLVAPEPGLVTGRVAATTPSGARTLVAVEVSGPDRPDLRLHTEVPPGHPVRPGDLVGLRIPIQAVAVVPTGRPAQPPVDDAESGGVVLAGESG
ncbi:ABC transporter ATP-binding protein [Nocardioides coralli]|uniref:ABC transporter ATP-binding protein n=1 Tax=Nocardioides coralli TaxID=2872154 RepID=UPI001CA40405|nr:ABC transporter ATP-binding protein [Nocardioides coralli]QZY30133.1 ABC transporter ATP-binding protein [Nocardioides coralli]